ncbi:target of Myb protein 1-like isoform X1 [Phalaenopsis equestris]|uniref:target of Myb protein 1-like isoform X1 n=1 Tax=Phalaenopsis equestris TaxID=78828 RepID=UPI0009E42F5F|nr:target of Myb protein 1-like isoform X1 [Phalaenopsis equestris]
MVPSLQSIFSTPSSAIGRVEKATSRLLLSPDWMMNMDICSSINADPWKAKSFVKAVRMRLQNKNSKVQFLALTLLETMIKNCDDFVHFQVVDRGILSEMVKIVRKSKNMEVREKILILLESWQETFRGPNGRYPQFYNTYVELKRSGVQFPEQSKNTDMILTLTDPMTTQPQKNYKISTNSIGRLHQVRSETGHFSLSDLNNIQSVMDLFNNILEVMNPNDDKAIKDEVITDLVKKCEINQKKLVQLINSTKNDRLLVEALRLNDSLQTLLSKHHSLVSRSSSPPETAPTPPLLSLPPPTPPFLSLPLPTPPTSNQLDNEKEEEDGFFALVKRNSISKSAGVQEVSHRSNELNTINSAEDLTSVADNALVLFDSPAPVSTSNKEENMIDLLSLTLSPNQASQRPPLPPPSLTQSQNPFSYSLGWEHFLSYPQPLMSNESYTVYNDYVAPWARPTAVQSPEIYNLSPHLPSSWNASEGSSNPFL